jgi:putative tributyrin esterase
VTRGFVTIPLVWGLVSLPAAFAAGGEQPARPRLETVEITSEAVGRSLRYAVLLPAGYSSDGPRYPALYLLHGIGGSYLSWNTDGVLEHAAAEHPGLVVVLPDAGNSWYVDWAESEGLEAWESYLIGELIPHVERSFHVVPRREGRALAGFSMGGYGALALGLRHPHLFASIGSTSGYLDYARSSAASLQEGASRSPRRRSRPTSVAASVEQWREAADPEIGVDSFDSQAERTPGGRVFATAAEAAAHDPYRLVLELPREELPWIALDCGTEDNLIGFTREMASLLLERGLAFTYRQEPGRHDDGYRAGALRHVLENHHEAMLAALGRTSSAKVGEPAPDESSEESR